MSDHRSLLEVDPQPRLLLFQADAKAAADAIGGWREAGLTVRTIRGRKMGTVDDLFDEVAAALQFPDYFGENWPAFDECFADMDWLPMDVGIVVVILEAEDVLADPADVELGPFCERSCMPARPTRNQLRPGKGGIARRCRSTSSCSRHRPALLSSERGGSVPEPSSWTSSTDAARVRLAWAAAAGRSRPARGS
jgi:hypothetical protein